VLFLKSSDILTHATPYLASLNNFSKIDYFRVRKISGPAPTAQRIHTVFAHFGPKSGVIMKIQDFLKVITQKFMTGTHNRVKSHQLSVFGIRFAQK